MSDNNPTATPASSFLFVNKNAQSNSFSRAGTREEAAAINSYAQKWYFEKSSKKGTKEPVTPPTGQPAKLKPLAAYISKVRVSQLSEDGPKPKRRRRKRPKKADVDIEAEIPYDADRQISPVKGAYAYLPPTSIESETSASSPPLMSINHLPGSSTDPFSRASLPMNGDVLPVLQYYLNFTLLATFNANTTTALTPAQQSHSAAIEWIITGCLNNKSHMYALLSATSSRMRRVSNVSLASTSSPEFFLSKAIESMRDNLANQALADQQTMLDMFYLSVCEWYMKSYDAARMHFSFLRHFWKDINPQKSVLQKYIHDMVSYNDIFLAVETGEKPFLNMKWDLVPLSEAKMTRVREAISSPQPQISPLQASLQSTSLLVYGSGFVFVERHDLVSDDLRQVFRSIPELMQIYHFTLQPTGDCEEESSYLSRKSQTLLHQLTSFPAYGYELCMRLSLIILFSSMSTSPAWRAGKVDTVRLATRLSRQLEYEIQVDLEKGVLDLTRSLWTGQDNMMLLWILLTGLFATGVGPEGVWFDVRAAKVVMFLGLDKSGIENLLHSFVYLPRLQAATFERWYHGCFG